MKSPILFLVALICLARLDASSASAAEAQPKLDVQSVIDMAQGAPGEFAADALLRIAAIDQLAPARRIRLLEEAFSRAAEAQQPLRRRNAMLNLTPNAAFLEHAYAQDLDALSLRTRVVEAMLPLDTDKARKLFTDIPPVDVPLVSCDDFMVFDVGRYYDALAAVTQRTFTPAEIHDGVQYQFLLQRIGVISSPAQIGPAARAVLFSGLRDADFPGAVAALTAALHRMTADDRSFTYYLRAAGEGVLALIAECQRRHMSPLPLMEGYRLYLVSNFGAARCADDDLSTVSGSASAAGAGTAQSLDQRAAEAIRFFNEAIRQPPLQPIPISEAAPSSRVGAAGGLRSCESSECQAIARQYRALVFNSTGMALPAAVRDTAEWQEQLRQFLSALSDWQDSADIAQQFREKCSLYEAVFGLLPNGPSRDMALRAMLEYLQRSRSKELSRIEWLLPVNTLIGRIGLDSFGASRIAEDLRRSTDPVIALYAQLEKIAPRGAAEIVPLM